MKKIVYSLVIALSIGGVTLALSKSIDLGRANCIISLDQYSVASEEDIDPIYPNGIIYSEV